MHTPLVKLKLNYLKLKLNYLPVEDSGCPQVRATTRANIKQTAFMIRDAVLSENQRFNKKIRKERK